MPEFLTIHTINVTTTDFIVKANILFKKCSQQKK